MTCRNDITGDKIQTKPGTKQYRDGWDAIFGKAGYDKPCCGKCNPCKGHEIENQKDEQNDREIQESK